MRVGTKVIGASQALAEFTPTTAPPAAVEPREPAVTALLVAAPQTERKVCTAKPDTAARTTSDNVGHALSSITDTALDNVPDELKQAAHAVLNARGSSADVLLCIDTVASYRRLVSAEQAQWLMRSLVSNHDFRDLDDVPATPLALAQALQLFGQGGPPPARQALHALALAGLKLGSEQAARAIAGLDTRSVARLSLFVPAKHPLTRTIFQTLNERRAYASASVSAHLGDDARRRFVASLDIGELPAMRPTTASATPAAVLAERFVAQGRALLAGHDLASVRDSILAASPLTVDDATILATSFVNAMKDGFGRCATFDHLVEALRMTSGEVFRVCNTVRQRDYNARPDFAGALNRAKDRPLLPTFPLYSEDSYSADIVASPVAASELFHEMGHAFECVRPDVLRAAIAFRDERAIGKARTLNDLNVIRELAGSDAEQERLLVHIAKMDTLPPLENADALHQVFDDIWPRQRIDAFAQKVNWLHARLFSQTEMAMPVIGPPYMGKLATNAGTTEVVSLGLEALATPETMQQLMDSCPDHLAFIIGALSEPTEAQRGTP